MKCRKLTHIITINGKPQPWNMNNLQKISAKYHIIINEWERKPDKLQNLKLKYKLKHNSLDRHTTSRFIEKTERIISTSNTSDLKAYTIK